MPDRKLKCCCGAVGPPYHHQPPYPCGDKLPENVGVIVKGDPEKLKRIFGFWTIHPRRKS